MLTVPRSAAAWLLLPVLALTGCYNYASVGGTAVRPGTELRARLTGAGAERVATQTGDFARTIDGTVLRAGRDEIVLRVVRADRRHRFRFDPIADTLAIPRRYVEALEAKRLSYWKTGALVGGLAAVAALLISQFAGGDDAGTPSNGGGGPNFSEAVPTPVP